MRIRIIAIGSQGDVRPYVALGVGLQKAGHHVRVVTHKGFKALVQEFGLDFAPVTGDPREMADNKQLKALHDDSRNLFRWWRTFNEVDAPLMRQRLRDCWEACSDADTVIVSFLPYLFGYAIAKKLDVPLIRGFYFPASPTRAYPPDFLPAWLRGNGRLHLASYQVQRQVLWQVARPWVSGACREILNINSLPVSEPFGELDRQQQLLLYCYSASVAPPPSDWGSWIQVTGYWFLDHSVEWEPPPALVNFLEDGPPPVYVGGFGSMTNREPAEFARTVAQALAATKQRAIMLAGWGGLSSSDIPPEVFTIDWIPFDWLLPRVAAVVHHGGAGTTAASLRAGVPTVIVPFFLDQFFWGRRIFELGAGPKPIPRKHLRSDTLARAIQAATSNPEMRARASSLGNLIRGEDGVARAVECFQRHMKVSA